MGEIQVVCFFVCLFVFKGSFVAKKNCSFKVCGHCGIPNISSLSEAHPPIMDKVEQSRNFPIRNRVFSQQAYHLAGKVVRARIQFRVYPINAHILTGAPILSQGCFERWEERPGLLLNLWLHNVCCYLVAGHA